MLMIGDPPVVMLITLLVMDRYLDRLSCTLTERTLEIRKGLLNRVESTVPLEKITDLQMFQGPIMRMLGLHGFRLETAQPSDDELLHLDTAQYDLQEGPCYDCYQCGEPIAERARPCLCQLDDKVGDPVKSSWFVYNIADHWRKAGIQDHRAYFMNPFDEPSGHQNRTGVPQVNKMVHDYAPGVKVLASTWPMEKSNRRVCRTVRGSRMTFPGLSSR